MSLLGYRLSLFEIILWSEKHSNEHLILWIGRLRRLLSQERDDIPIISTCIEYLKHDNYKEGGDSSLLSNGTYLYEQILLQSFLQYFDYVK